MTKIVTTIEAGNDLAALVDWVSSHDEAIIIENQGNETVAIISAADFRNFEDMRDQAMRRDALAKVRELRATISARNASMSESEVEEFADDLVREAIDSMFAKGIVRYED